MRAAKPLENNTLWQAFFHLRDLQGLELSGFVGLRDGLDLNFGISTKSSHGVSVFFAGLDTRRDRHRRAKAA